MHPRLTSPSPSFSRSPRFQAVYAIVSATTLKASRANAPARARGLVESCRMRRERRELVVGRRVYPPLTAGGNTHATVRTLLAILAGCNSRRPHGRFHHDLQPGVDKRSVEARGRAASRYSRSLGLR
ncbi:hypothetical protein N657DRAFT_651180 [Parathielavia appendiculata]|uniref:Uncharacterized protein n=1 Tax=Parathielavia appendiculata TaxID=2587402 RepID=A0AAN6TPZ8_9PEZI|nr:hypothetical protein N657DRAFT_651180 [Parathielavia appendiculata]